MTIRQIIEDRIRDQCDFNEVAGTTSLEVLFKNRVSDNGCYVYRMRTRSRTTGDSDRITQQRSEIFAVVIVTRNVSADRGDASDINEAKCAEVEAALLGWPPTEFHWDMEHVSGDLVAMKNGFTYWQDVYSTGSEHRGG